MDSPTGNVAEIPHGQSSSGLGDDKEDTFWLYGCLEES